MPEIVSRIQIEQQGVPYVEYGVTHGYETCLLCWLYGSSIQATYELTYPETGNRMPLCSKHAAQAEQELRDV